MSFRTRFVLASAGLVLATVIVMVVPLLLSSRDHSLELYRERLSATAKGASVAVPADSIRRIKSDSSAVIAYFTVRLALREFLWSGVDSSQNTRDGLLVVAPDHNGFKTLVSAFWPPTSIPPGSHEFKAPPGLKDSLASFNVSTSKRWWFIDGDRLVAAEPILDGTVPIALVIATTSRSAATADMISMLRRLVLYPIGTIVAAILLAMALGSGLTHRIRVLADRARVLATGDLRVDTSDTGRDELGMIGTALSELGGNLRAIVGDVRGGATEVGSAAQDLAAGATQLRESSTQVASAAAAIALASESQRENIESITSLANSAASQAAMLAVAAAKARTAADDVDATARRTMSEAVAARETMERIGAVTAASLPAIVELEAKGQQIHGIARAVGELANQANLLSLNAAIEAARAGEHGRGFAVVASEVRRLSTATDEALESIRKLSEEIERVSRDTIGRIRAVEESVEDGKAAVGGTTTALDRIVSSIEGTRSAIVTIAEHASTQEERATAVASHVLDIASAARANASSANEVSALARAQTGVATTVHESTLRLGSVHEQLEQLEGSLEGFVFQS